MDFEASEVNQVMESNHLRWSTQLVDIWDVADQLHKNAVQVDAYIEAVGNDRAILEGTKSRNKKVFPVHKIMLAAASPFLCKLLQEHYADYRDPCPTITIPGIPPGALRHILNLLYVGRTTGVHLADRETVIEATQLLQINGILQYWRHGEAKGIESDGCVVDREVDDIDGKYGGGVNDREGGKTGDNADGGRKIGGVIFLDGRVVEREGDGGKCSGVINDRRGKLSCDKADRERGGAVFLDGGERCDGEVDVNGGNYGSDIFDGRERTGGEGREKWESKVDSGRGICDREINDFDGGKSDRSKFGIDHGKEDALDKGRCEVILDEGGNNDGYGCGDVETCDVEAYDGRERRRGQSLDHEKCNRRVYDEFESCGKNSDQEKYDDLVYGENERISRKDYDDVEMNEDFIGLHYKIEENNGTTVNNTSNLVNITSNTINSISNIVSNTNYRYIKPNNSVANSRNTTNNNSNSINSTSNTNNTSNTNCMDKASISNCVMRFNSDDNDQKDESVTCIKRTATHVSSVGDTSVTSNISNSLVDVVGESGRKGFLDEEKMTDNLVDMEEDSNANIDAIKEVRKSDRRELNKGERIVNSVVCMEVDRSENNYANKEETSNSMTFENIIRTKRKYLKKEPSIRSTSVERTSARRKDTLLGRTAKKAYDEKQLGRSARKIRKRYNSDMYELSEPKARKSRTRAKPATSVKKYARVNCKDSGNLSDNLDIPSIKIEPIYDCTTLEDTKEVTVNEDERSRTSITPSFRLAFSETSTKCKNSNSQMLNMAVASQKISESPIIAPPITSEFINPSFSLTFGETTKYKTSKSQMPNLLFTSEKSLELPIVTLPFTSGKNSESTITLPVTSESESPGLDMPHLFCSDVSYLQDETQEQKLRDLSQSFIEQQDSTALFNKTPNLTELTQSFIEPRVSSVLFDRSQKLNDLSQSFIEPPVTSAIYIKTQRLTELSQSFMEPQVSSALFTSESLDSSSIMTEDSSLLSARSQMLSSSTNRPSSPLKESPIIYHCPSPSKRPYEEKTEENYQYEEDGLFKFQVLIKSCEDLAEGGGVSQGGGEVGQQQEEPGGGVDINQWIAEEIDSYLQPKTTNGNFNKESKGMTDQSNAGPEASIKQDISISLDTVKKEHNNTGTGISVDADNKDQQVLIQCEQCEKTFPDHRRCQYHVRLVHREARQMCRFCGRLFKRRCDLNQHERRHNAASLPCELCEKVFKLPKDLAAHLATHTREKQYVCNVCNKVLSSLRNLRNHIASIHDKLRAFECHLCNKVYSKSSSLQVHIRSVHTGERPFVCTVCKKAFTNSALLKMHGSVHTGELKYSCKVCGRRFTQYCNMRTHMRGHSHQQTFTCSLCKETFQMREDLTKHKRTHKGFEPLLCVQCSKEYHSKEGYDRHMLRCHRGFSSLPDVFLEMTEEMETRPSGSLVEGSLDQRITALHVVESIRDSIPSATIHVGLPDSFRETMSSEPIRHVTTLNVPDSIRETMSTNTIHISDNIRNSISSATTLHVPDSISETIGLSAAPTIHVTDSIRESISSSPDINKELLENMTPVVHFVKGIAEDSGQVQLTYPLLSPTTEFDESRDISLNCVTGKTTSMGHDQSIDVQSLLRDEVSIPGISEEKTLDDLSVNINDAVTSDCKEVVILNKFSDSNRDLDDIHSSSTINIWIPDGDSVIENDDSLNDKANIFIVSDPDFPDSAHSLPVLSSDLVSPVVQTVILNTPESEL